MSFKNFLYTMALIIALNLSATLPKGMWNYFSSDSSRLPSSAFGGIGKRLDDHLKNNLINQASIKYVNGNAYITLSSLLSEHQITSFCKDYENIELKFLSADMFVNGKPSEMTVTSSCSEQHKLGALLIPFTKINNLKVVPQKLNEIQLIQFKNVASEWPQEWDLAQVMALKKNGQLKVILSNNEIFESDKRLKIQLTN